MTKKYTVFVSSTYQDLIEERQEVMQALLEMDCIPCGMELFPAADDEQLEFIKSVIDDCDYYVLILAGRYGALSQSGVSYTELEYRYAIEKNIPIIAFIRQDIETLPYNKCEHDAESIAKLKEFQLLVKRRLCKFWSTKDQLSGLVSRSMINLIKRHPAVGWIRANVVSTEETLLKTIELYEENRELRSQKENAVVEDSDIYESGDTQTTIVYNIYENGINNYQVATCSVTMSWDEILILIGPLLIEEQTRRTIRGVLDSRGREEYISSLKSDDEVCNFEVDQHISVSDASMGEILIQLMGLDYLCVQLPNHDNDYTMEYETTYVLTELGRKQLIRLMAKRKAL